MQKDLKGRSERSETVHSNMAALERGDERLDPSTRVLTRISKRGRETLFILSITTKIEMTCIG